MTEKQEDTETFKVTLTSPCPTPELAFDVIDITNLKVTVNVTKCNPGAGHSWKPNSLNLSGEDDNAINNPGVGVHVYTFRNAGTYTLYLIGENDCGKVANAQRTVTVSAPPPQKYPDGTTVCLHDSTDPNFAETCTIADFSSDRNDYLLNRPNGKQVWSSKFTVGACVLPASGRLEELTYPASAQHRANIRVGFKIHNTGGSTGTFIARLYQGSTKVGGDWRAVVHAGNSPSGAITVTAPSSGTSVSYTLKLFLET